MKNKLLVSFSGGRTSAYMAHLLFGEYRKCVDNICFVFANTGKEREETLEFINECDERWGLGVNWIEYDTFNVHGKKTWYKIVDFKTASRNGEPFDKLINKEGIPNAAFPMCSDRLKAVPISKFMRHHIGWKKYDTAIGIRYDEKHRINWKTAKERQLVYPLATTHRVNEEFVRSWWDKQDFDLKLKDYQGNCDFCWKKSDRKLITLLREGLDVSWWAKHESKSEYNFFRGDKSLADLIEMSKNKRIKSVEDVHEVNLQQECLFDPLDLEASCFCR